MEVFSGRCLILTVVCIISVQLISAGELDVNIAVLSDSKTPSSYYNFGSSATLVCHVKNTAGPVTYHWQSTNTDFFAYNSSSMFNRKRLLSAADAGVHTCTVTDDEGNTGSAMLPMMFQGIGMYVTKSYGKKESVLTNNSAILYYPSSCSDCSIEFYCFSNSTQSGVGDVVFPDGSVHTTSTRPSVKRLDFSTLRVKVSNSHPVTGIFTCRLPDSNGNILESSVILSRSKIGRPQISAPLSGYKDLSMDTETPFLAQVECYTITYPPTSVVWKKNGVKLDILSPKHHSLQVVVDRNNLHYINILRLKSVFDVMGNNTFTCEVSNDAGTSLFSINIHDIPVVPESKVDILPKSSSGLEREVITLSCTGSVVPMKATAQLVPYITTEWVGPSGVSLTHENDITLSQPIQSDSGVVQTLTINGTMYYHSGVYSCIVTLNDTLRAVEDLDIARKKNITVYDSEDAVYETNHTEGSVVCVWDREPLPAMEWMFIGSNRIIPLTVTNETWDMETFQCFVQTSSKQQPFNSTIIVEAILIENITIEVSEAHPQAGSELKMTCKTDSYGPVALSWVGPNGNKITHQTPDITLETIDNGLSLVFPTLRTSQGGIYTCIADVVGDTSVQRKQVEHLLRVTIPNPIVSISSTPNRPYPNQQLVMNCGVRFVPEVDTPVNISIVWSAPTAINSRATVTRGESRNSTLVIESVSFSDAGLYTCTASIEPSGFANIQQPLAIQGLNIEIPLNVSITVNYSAPSDFSLPSPPYYRPASSVTLTCVAPPDAVLPLSYRWSSTCSSCSVAGSTSRQITINILKSSDAGVHTCTVTDRQSHTGSAVTTMTLIGAGVYVTDTSSSRAVPNNTLIYHPCRSCQLTIYCYSNSSSQNNTALLTIPNIGDTYSYNRNPIRVQRVPPSGITLVYSNYYYYSRPSGTYICKVPDSEGREVHFSFGLYFTSANRPYIYSSTSVYSHTSDTSIVHLQCDSYNSIPSVTWLRNGEPVDDDNDLYQVVDMVNTQRSLTSSYFRSILIVRSLLGGLGSQSYTCLFQNTFGNHSRIVSLRRKVVQIDASTRQPVYGRSLTLTCRNIRLPKIYTEEVTVEWIGPDGGNFSGNNDISVGRQVFGGSSFSKTLTIDYVKSSMNGVYTCKISIKYQNEVYTETATYIINITGSMQITGNEVRLPIGTPRSIRCSWHERDLIHLAWYLEGLYSVPLAYTDTSSSVTLYVDPSTTGLNGTMFVCRATDSTQSIYQETTSIILTDISVEIQVVYNAAPDFNLPAPYYQPASSITLSCIVKRASLPVTYRWNSTSTRSFTHLRRDRVISTSTLTRYDSGRHTCSVTDRDGTSVSASTDISLYGIGVFNSASSRSIANNSALYRSSWSTSHYFYCYSNSSNDSVTTILPNGNYLYSGTAYSVSVSQRTPNGVYIRPRRSSFYSTMTGIYTCQMTDLNTHQKRYFSFGVYQTPISRPRISSIHYVDLSKNDTHEGFGIIICSSSEYPPTTVTWRQNNEIISYDNTSFRQTVELISRSSSGYNSTLIITDYRQVIGSFMYTCTVGNEAGTVSQRIFISQNIDPLLSLSVKMEPEYLRNFSLSCRASVPQTLLPHILQYMTLAWITDLDNNITTETLTLDKDSLSLNLTLPSVNESYNGIYTCRFVLNFPTVITREVHYTLSVKALSISTDHTPLIVGNQNEITCSVYENEHNLFKMELILSHTNETIATANDTKTLTHTLIPDMSLNGTDVICIAISNSDLVVFLNSFTLHLAELVHDVRIEMEPVVPVAGERLTLSCIATADFPTTLSWRQPNGTNGNVSSMTVDGKMYIVNLTFDSLRMLNGGIFECVSEMISVNRTTSQTVKLEVKVPQPNVTISRVDNHSNLTLVCNVSIVEEVDVPVAVQLDWTGPNTNSAVSMFNTSNSGFSYSSNLTITNFTYTDSGEYICTVRVHQITERISNQVVVHSEQIHLVKDIDVTVTVEYTSPPDFSMPSPPYFRPASSVTLICNVPSDLIGTVTYEWVSTNSESFVHNARGQTISKDILTGFDAGEHRCIARDGIGNTGSDGIKMKIYGAGIYIDQGSDHSSSAVGNNTAVRFARNQFSFYCLSNSTLTEYIPTVYYPNGQVYPNTSNSYIRVNRFESGLHVSSEYNVRGGIYTCSLADSSGHTIDLSVGLYGYLRTPDTQRMEYSFHVNDLYTDVLATVNCYTGNYPPTFVEWRRDGDEVPIDGIKYELQQTVTNHRYSNYKNTLIIRNIAGLPRYYGRYTCETTNSAGSSRITETSYTENSYHISLLPVEIVPDPSAHYGYSRGKYFSLTCLVHLRVSQVLVRKLRLLESIDIQWSDKHGSLKKADNIKIVDSIMEGNISSTLHFKPLRPWNDVLYTCTAMIDNPKLTIEPKSADYRIILGKTYFQLSFYEMPCSTLHDSNYTELENGIVHTLTNFIDQGCKCGFKDSMIDQGEFHCTQDDGINYRARVVGGSDILSAEKIMGILEGWLATDGTFLYNDSGRKRRIWVDSDCPLKISSFAAKIC